MSGYKHFKTRIQVDQSESGPHFLQIPALVCRFKLEIVRFYASGSQTVVCTDYPGMPSKGHQSLSIIRCKIFKIDQAYFLIGHFSEHLKVMVLFFSNMSKKQVCLTGNEGSFINF